MWLARTCDYILVSHTFIPGRPSFQTMVTRTGKPDVCETNLSPKKMNNHNKPHQLTMAGSGGSWGLGAWGPQFCGALCNGETKRLLAGGAGSPPVGSEAEPRRQTHFGNNILKIG